MNERPILFSGSMVRLLLAGTKTQTRRVVKGLHPDCYTARLHGIDWKFYDQFDRLTQATRCPYGQPGDRLWVREAWGYFDPDGTGEDYDELNGPGPTAFCDELLQEGHPLRDFWRRRVAYKATFAEGKYGKGPVGPNKWRPSIHMPRWASRITLEVTGVRVERLQDISEADAMAEGCTGKLSEQAPAADQARWDYRDLWESINGHGSWDANPWVWAVAIRRITP